VRMLTCALIALLVVIQYPLWLGKGGWLRVWDLERQVALQQGSNDRLLERNRSLEGEVRDLREGTGALEERARYELGMMRSDEIFVQLPDVARSALGSASNPQENRATEAQQTVAAAPARSRNP
jgi:cell division protein FtsB